jgi:hypothetical protein
MHFTRKYAFTLIVQHLLSQIKRRDHGPETWAGKGFKLKETGNESIPKYDPIKQTKT